jgi:bifunctional DNA-binding transcriptional regulator/antitoxin component of YhaV-PrlF toxin-antitoxin module
MRLQKQMSRKIGKTEYAKYVVVIPPKAVEELCWKEGEELEFIIKDKKLIIQVKD